MSRQVIVLGNHRTGSSCLAGVLSKLGVSMGKEMLGAHPSNPGGHFEDKEFLMINDTVVGHWDNPRVEFGEKELEELRATYCPIVERRNFDARIWGMKDPRLCILLPVYLPLFNDPIILHIVRNYDASIQSLIKREKWGEEKARKVLDIYTEAKSSAIELVEREGVPIKTVHFENLVSSPEETIRDFLPTILSRWDSGLWPSTFLIGQAVKHVNPEYIHHE